MQYLLYLSRSQDGSWIAEHSQGPVGRGPTAESALDQLRDAFISEREWGGWWPSPLWQDWEQDIETILSQRCLHVSREAFESAFYQELGQELGQELEPARTWWSPRLRRGSTANNEDHSGLSMPPPRRVSALKSVRAFSQGGFFRRQQILVITSSHMSNQPLGLEANVLPAIGGSTGLFSFDGARLRCLNRMIHNLEETFLIENRPLDDAIPAELADLIAEAIGREGNHHHIVITAETLESFESDPLFPGWTYQLDRKEFARISPSLEQPLVSSTPGDWLLQFTTVSGWAHELQTVVSWRVEVSTNFTVKVDQEVLSNRIFSETPRVIY